MLTIFHLNSHWLIKVILVADWLTAAMIICHYGAEDWKALQLWLRFQ